MIDELVRSLSAIEDANRHLGRVKLLELLQPGESSGRVRSTLGEVGLGSTDEIEALYGWRDGIADTDAAIGQITLWPAFYQMSSGGRHSR